MLVATLTMKCFIEKQSILFFLSFLFISQIFSQTSDPLLSFSYFPSDLSLDCSDEIPSVIDYPVVLLDTADTGCNDILALSFDDIVVDGVCPNSYFVERVWSAGICGETIYDIQTFSFLDTSPPTIISPIDGSHVCETDPMNIFPAAHDNCQLTVLLYFELDETVICDGITKRDYTITGSDNCGNTTIETRSVYVHDIDSNGDCLSDSFCQEDLNSDGYITIQDLLLILSEFGCVTACEHDITQDGYVAVDDLLLVLSEFGIMCCE